MANRTATLYIRINKDGKDSFCKPVYLSKGRLKPQYAMVNGNADQSAGNEAGSPLILFRPALSSISGDVFLRDSVYDGTDSRPDAGTRTHRAGFVRGVEHEVGQVAAITT